ncbi:MAG: ABC transporter ATP-binding protein [Flavobacteriales bacterium]|nr:ABC transporter ATP-binding protein [Flavobacteriales bacterium]
MNRTLQLSNLSIGYKKPLIKGISSVLTQGEIALLIGKNGVGKTTLIKTLMQEVLPISGAISINSDSLDVQNFHQYVSVVLSNTNIHSGLTVVELLELGRFPYKKWYQKITKKERKWINKIIEFTNLEKYKNYSINELSDGNLQKACIARAMVQDTDFLILDEPTTHLDLENKLMILDLLKNFSHTYNKGILFTSHDWEYSFKIADKLWCFKDNEFYSGETEDLALQLNLYEEIPYFEFNYAENTFIKKTENKSQKVDLSLTDEKTLFWFKHALLKNNFTIDSNAQIKIGFNKQNKTFSIYSNNVLIKEVEFIYECINELKRL